MENFLKAYGEIIKHLSVIWQSQTKIIEYQEEIS